MENKRFYLPYPIEDETTRKSMLKRGIEVTCFRFGNMKCFVALVPNYNEKIYRDFLKETWSDSKRKENEERCRIPDKKGGDWKVCHDNCGKCSNERSGRHDSLDYQKEETGIEVIDSSPDAFERATLGMILESLSKTLCKRSPAYGKIFDEIYHEKSQAEVAIFSEKSTGTIGEQFQKTISIAKAILEKIGYKN